MPAKWQQWMPFRIDAFKASAAVQAMCPAARMGYLYLLTYSWQTDDCTIPNDPMQLAEISGLGDELWALHGPRILRKFHTVTAEKLRNDVCYQEWVEARRVFDSRQQAANRTNSARSPKHMYAQSPDGHRVALPSEPSRSAYTRTGTETGTITEKQEPDTIDVRCLSESVGIFGMREQADMARLLALTVKESGMMPQVVMEHMISRWVQYQQESAGHDWQYGSSYKFFMSGKWDTPATWANGKPTNKPPNPGATATDDSEAHAREVWESMSDEYKRKNPWVEA